MFTFNPFRHEPAPSDSTIETHEDTEGRYRKEYEQSRKDFDSMSLDELRQEYREEDERLTEEDAEILEEADEERRDRRVEGADFDALKHAYAEKIAHALQNGEPVTMEEKRFLLEDMSDRKPDSALGRMVFKSHGYKTAQEAMSRMGVKRVVSADGSMKLDNEQESWLKQQSPHVQELVSDVAKGGVATAAACGIIALLGGPIAWGVVGASFLGGVAGKAIARGIARKDMYNGLNEDAMREMLTEVGEVRSLANTYLDAHKRGADKEETLNGILNGIVNLTHSKTGRKINGDPGASAGFNKLKEFQAKEKGSKKWEMAGGFLGALAAGGLASVYGSAIANRSAEFSQAVADAKVNGVRMYHGQLVGDGSQAGHIVKYVDNAWRFVTEQGDINSAQSLLHDQYGKFFHVIGQGGGPHLEMSQQLFDQFSSNGLDLLHVSEMSGVPEAILAQMKQDIITRGLQQAAIVGGMFTVGDLLVNTAYEGPREKALKESADKTMHELFTPGVTPVTLRPSEPPIGAFNVYTPAERPQEVRPTQENGAKDTLLEAIKPPRDRLDEVEKTVADKDTLEKLNTSEEDKKLLAGLLNMDEGLIGDKDRWPQHMSAAIIGALARLQALEGKTNEEIAAAIYKDSDEYSKLNPEQKVELSIQVKERFDRLKSQLISLQKLLDTKPETIDKEPVDELGSAKKNAEEFIATLRTKDEEDKRKAIDEGRKPRPRGNADYAESIQRDILQWDDMDSEDGVILFVNDPASADVAGKIQEIEGSGRNVKVFLKTAVPKGGRVNDVLDKYATDLRISKDNVYLLLGRDIDWKGYLKNLSIIATQDIDSSSVAAANSQTVEFEEI